MKNDFQFSDSEWANIQKLEKEAEKYNLSVDDRKQKPFHCNLCGDTYEACNHWVVLQ